MSTRPKSVLIYTTPIAQVGLWDPSSIKTGIGGAEEAVIYLADALARIGYRVVVVGYPPVVSPHTLPYANPRYIYSDDDDNEPVDVAICWRFAMKAKLLKSRAKKMYFWPQEICFSRYDDMAAHLFDDVFWLSSWQREQWISLCPGFARFTTIFGNGINPDQFEEVQERKNPYSCIYASQYSNGLKVLFDIWPQVKEQFPLASLDLYYGWQSLAPLPDEEKQRIRKQYDALQPLDVREHGFVGHKELTQAYEKASFWTYPNTLFETFCISALRAQLAGAVPVIIENSALKETVRSGFRCKTPDEYLPLLLQAMQSAKSISLSERKKMGAFVKRTFTWDKIAQKMKALFEN